MTRKLQLAHTHRAWGWAHRCFDPPKQVPARGMAAVGAWASFVAAAAQLGPYWCPNPRVSLGSTQRGR